MAIFHPSSPPSMALSLRVLSHLLRYPDADLHAGLDELQQALHAEGALPRGRLAELDVLLRQLRSAPPLDSEAAYVELFDRGRGTALHLFEHVHGDSRERGPAMIDLARTYEQAGLYLDPGELPDHLSVVLEYASTQPPAQAREFLRELAHILQTIFSALQQRRSPYAGVLAALLDLAGEPAQRVALAPEPTLDESWAEPPAFDGCSSAGQARPGQPQPVQIVRRPAPPQGSPQGANP
jgi:nitrate reductase delta subunit